MTIVYAEESLKSCLEEMKPILELHYQEVAMYKDKIPLDPDYSKYFMLEEEGVFHTVTVRDNGKLIGYFLSLIAPSIHYSQTVYAVNDILYVHPDYRASGVGQKMFSFAEKKLKEKGADVISIHMKTALPFDSLCEGMGYDYAERNYTKYIGVL
jgi:GNAT superfamily N-acetyltransferase